MQHFDLCVIGSGTGNSLIDERLSTMKVALVDEAERFGGTCLLAGCIPTKMFTHTADIAVGIRDASRFGIGVGEVKADWPAIRDRVFGRIDPISQAGERYRAESQTVSLLRGHAEFVSADQVVVTGADGQKQTITADTFVIAAGSRPFLPEVAGLDDPGLDGRVHTSDTVMRMDVLPASMIILGSSAVALEMAHLFDGLGVDVTLIARSGALLRNADRDVSRVLTDQVAARLTVRLHQDVTEVEPAPHGLTLYTTDAHGIEYSYQAESLLVATGRVPNTDHLGLAAAGVEVDDHGFIPVDDRLTTSVPSIFALGDVVNRHMLKHLANYQARIIAHNIAHPSDPTAVDGRPLPWAVFGTPQVAAIGATEAELEGRNYVAGTHRYADVAYGWALEDTTGFCKVLADPDTGRLLGAWILGPEASILLQPLVLAMTAGIDVPTLARGEFWPHPALSEVVENALLDLHIDPPRRRRLLRRK